MIQRPESIHEIDKPRWDHELAQELSFGIVVLVL
jgi:hypothetical protein